MVGCNWVIIDEVCHRPFQEKTLISGVFRLIGMIQTLLKYAHVMPDVGANSIMKENTANNSLYTHPLKLLSY